jgi:hypothetical protein
MRVESIGLATQLSKLNPGQCFLFEASDGLRWGMLTKDENHHQAILVFAHSKDDRNPWVVAGGLPQTVFLVPDVNIKTEWTSLSLGSAAELGALTSAAGNFYIRAAFQKAQTVVINITNGMTEDPPQSGPTVHFTRWTAGIGQHDKWKPLFEFPFKPGSA